MHIIVLLKGCGWEQLPAAKQTYLSGQFMSLPFPISVPQPCTGKTTLLSCEPWHIGHPWHQRWSQIGVVCSKNIQNGSIGTAFIPEETIWKPVAHGLMVSFDRHAGPTFGCALNQTIGSVCNGRLALATQCQQHRMLLPEATSCQNLTPWWRLLQIITGD